MSKWRQLRHNLACMWPRVLWLQSDNESPGEHLVGGRYNERAVTDNVLAALGDEHKLTNYDAWESVIQTLKRRLLQKRNATLPPFDWKTPARSCEEDGRTSA
eukprot:4925775-Pleurochrysis_carterae.AAC.2